MGMTLGAASKMVGVYGQCPGLWAWLIGIMETFGQAANRGAIQGKLEWELGCLVAVAPRSRCLEVGKRCSRGERPRNVRAHTHVHTRTCTHACAHTHFLSDAHPEFLNVQLSVSHVNSNNYLTCQVCLFSTVLLRAARMRDSFTYSFI